MQPDGVVAALDEAEDGDPRPRLARTRTGAAPASRTRARRRSSRTSRCRRRRPRCLRRLSGCYTNGTCAGSAHRRPHPRSPTAPSKAQRCVVRSLIAVVDHGPPPHRARPDQLGAQMVSHRPADNIAASRVENDSQIQEPCCGRNERDVGYPQHFGPLAEKLGSTKSGAGRASRSRRVVCAPPRRRLTPTSPASRICRAIRLRPCLLPPAQSSACTRGTP